MTSEHHKVGLNIIRRNWDGNIDWLAGWIISGAGTSKIYDLCCMGSSARCWYIHLQIETLNTEIDRSLKGGKRLLDRTSGYRWPEKVRITKIVIDSHSRQDLNSHDLIRLIP